MYSIILEILLAYLIFPLFLPVLIGPYRYSGIVSNLHVDGHGDKG